MTFAKAVIISILATWFVIALITVISDDETFARLPVDIVDKILSSLYSGIFIKPVPQKQYEKLRKRNFYKGRIGKNWHIITYCGVAGDKNEPMIKRMLSHLWIIVHFRVIEETEAEEEK